MKCIMISKRLLHEGLVTYLERIRHLQNSVGKFGVVTVLLGWRTAFESVPHILECSLITTTALCSAVNGGSV